MAAQLYGEKTNEEAEVAQPLKQVIDSFIRSAGSVQPDQVPEDDMLFTQFADIMAKVLFLFVTYNFYFLNLLRGFYF